MPSQVIVLHASPAVQERSQRSLRRMLAAAETVLGRDGWSGFTMNAVAAQAEVSIGGIYRRFASKEHLLRAVKDNVLNRADARQNELAHYKATKAADALAYFVKGRLASIREYAGVLHEVLAGQSNDAVMFERGRQSIDLGVNVFRKIMAPVKGEIDHTDPDLAIDMAFYIFNATVLRRVRHSPTDTAFDYLDWDVLERELLGAITRYLLPKQACEDGGFPI